MKKQILFMMFLSLAFFISGINNVFAQDDFSGITCPIPIPITATCVETANGKTPMAGTDYTYTITVQTPADGTRRYHWMVTTDQIFIDGSQNGLISDPEDPTNSDYIDAIASGVYDDIEDGVASIEIRWKYFVHDDANPVFLVIYVDNEDDCITDNMEVYIIKPVHSFTLDLASISADGTEIAGIDDDPMETCVAPVASALWNIEDETLDFDYGVNYLYYVVTAANFAHSWMPSFQVDGTGLTDSRRITAIDWGYPNETMSWNTTSTVDGDGNPVEGTAGTIWNGTTAVEIQAEGETVVGSEGECIIVRVTVANNQEETIINAPITLAVDGIMYDSSEDMTNRYETASLGDLHHSDNPNDSDDCPWVDGFANDVITQILTARPDLEEVVPPTPAFEPTNRD